MRITLVVGILVLGPVAAAAQQSCQPLQGTAAHATCINEQLSRGDTALRKLEEQAGAAGPAPGFVAPDLNLSRRDGPPVPAYAPEFTADQAAQRRRLEQSTQARKRALSEQVGSSLQPRLGIQD